MITDSVWELWFDGLEPSLLLDSCIQKAFFAHQREQWPQVAKLLLLMGASVATRQFPDGPSYEQLQDCARNDALDTTCRVHRQQLAHLQRDVAKLTSVLAQAMQVCAASQLHARHLLKITHHENWRWCACSPAVPLLVYFYDMQISSPGLGSVQAADCAPQDASDSEPAGMPSSQGMHRDYGVFGSSPAQQPQQSTSQSSKNHPRRSVATATPPHNEAAAPPSRPSTYPNWWGDDADIEAPAKPHHPQPAAPVHGDPGPDPGQARMHGAGSPDDFQDWKLLPPSAPLGEAPSESMFETSTADASVPVLPHAGARSIGHARALVVGK